MTQSGARTPNGPADALARARALEEASRYADALAVLAHAHKAAPQDPTILTAQSRCLSALGRFGAAMDAARDAVALAPRSAEAHYLAGFAAENLGDLATARTAYEAAASLAPRMADAVARLAALAARRGDWTEARTRAARALALAPGHAAAQFALVMADMADDRFAAAETRARRIAGDAAYQPQIRANALNFLGDALDRQNRTDEAFAAYTQSNTALKSLHRTQFEHPDVPSGIGTTRRLLAEFEALGARDWTSPNAPPSPAEGHVFILGFPRSGTTLLAEILAGHPGAHVSDERNLLGDALRHFTGRPGGLRALAEADTAALDPWRERYWPRARAEGAGNGMLIDKSPFHTLHLPLIAKLFPQAKILFAVRDPRDVAFACFRRLFALNPFLYECLTLEGTATLYDAVMRLGEAYRASVPLALLEVRNDALIADPDGELTRLCSFLGIAPNPSMTDFARRTERRAIASPQSAGLADGVSATSRGQWRRYAEHLAPILPIVAPWVRRFGYGA
jgi:Flp pilus assembly protein TadD